MARVIGAVEPCTLVETNADVTPQICKPQRKHATGERDEAGADEDPENSQQRPGREFRGDRSRGCTRDLRRCWTGYNSCAAMICLLIVSCGQLQSQKGPAAI